MLQGVPVSAPAAWFEDNPKLHAIWQVAEKCDNPSAFTVISRAPEFNIEIDPILVTNLEDMSVPAEARKDLINTISNDRLLVTLKRAVKDHLETVPSLGKFRKSVDEAFANLSRDDDSKSLFTSAGEFLESVEDGNQGIKTGFNLIDHYLDGLQPGQLITIGGYTGHGKSALSLNMALRMAGQHRVAYKSLEMTRQELSLRAMSILSGIPSRRIRNNEVVDWERPNLDGALEEMKEMKLMIDDIPNGNYHHVEAAIRKMKPDVAIIDHLHLMSAGAGKRLDDIAYMTRRFKLLSGDMGIPIIILAQLSRPENKAVLRRPTLRDLRDSGTIEQDSNTVLFIFKDERTRTPNEESEVELIVSKNRSGPIGDFKLSFNPETTGLKDYF